MSKFALFVAQFALFIPPREIVFFAPKRTADLNQHDLPACSLSTNRSKSVVLKDLVLEASVVLRNEVLGVKLLPVLFVQLAHLLGGYTVEGKTIPKSRSRCKATAEVAKATNKKDITQLVDRK